MAGIEEDLVRLGQRVCDEIEGLGIQCEENPPVLTQFDSWGNRIDRIDTCHAWNKMKAISAKEGFVSIGYERRHAEWRYRDRQMLVQWCQIFMTC